MSDTSSSACSVPAWYQELSDRQIVAVDSLHHQLQIAAIANETANVRQCLYGIGIAPLPSDTVLCEIIVLSRGSDLLLLWTLWQMLYERPTTSAASYTLNERLLFSALCHLDMVTTLRALDAIMPRSVVPNIKVSVEKAVVKCRVSASSQLSPYLQRLPRPRRQRSSPPRSLQWPAANIEPYEKFADGGYVVANEATRWFANTSRSDNNNTPSPLPLNAETKETIISNICHMKSDQKCRVAMHLHNLLQCCRITKATTDDDTPCQMHDALYTTISCYTLAGIDDADQFERMARVYFQKQSLRKCAKALISHTAKLQHIVVCPKCLYCRRLNTNYRKSIVQYEQSVGHRVRFVDEPANDFGRMIDDYVYRQDELSDEQLAMALDEAAVDYLRESSDHDDVLLLCLKNIRKMDVVLWNNYHSTKAMTAAAVDELRPLRVALDTLQNDPKFVLAALPDAHRVPALAEWWRRRYGHRLSQSDRVLALAHDQPKWRAFTRRFFVIDEPEVEDVLNGQTKISYGKQHVLKDRIAELNRNYYHRLSNQLIDRQRRLWTVLRPHLCVAGSVRRTFFAYMPSHEYEVCARGLK